MAVADDLRRFFAARTDDVAAAWLFGSQARGTARADSDVDVAVLFKVEPPRTLMGLPVELEEALTRVCGGKRVQLIVANRASADLMHQVLRDGVLLADHDRRARILFEVRKRNEYFDLKPMLDRYRKAQLRRTT
jgi:predicted nucleotidyltransferase